MTDEQKKKRNFRNSKKWKEFKKQKKAECKGIDYITQKPLHKGFQLHHEDLNSEHYTDLNDNFLCCNRMTHDFIHWVYRYYKTDKEIIKRLEKEMQKMDYINNGGTKE